MGAPPFSRFLREGGEFDFTHPSITFQNLLLLNQRIHTSPNLHHLQQIPSLPILRPLRPLAPRREVQRLLLPHRRIRNDVPLPHRNHPHRKKIHRAFFILLPPRPHHIQAVLIPAPAIDRRLHLHPPDRTSILHRHVIPPRLPKRLQHSQPQPLGQRHKTKLRPLPAFLTVRNPLRIVFLPLHVP